VNKVERLKELARNLAARGREIAEEARGAPDAHKLTGDYHEWFAAARVLLHQVQPMMVAEFVTLYEGTGGSANYGDYERLGISDGLGRFDWTPARAIVIKKIIAQAGMLSGLPTVIDLHVMDLRSLAAYDIMSDELAAAGHLVETGYTRAAGAVGSVVLERHLKLMCANRNIAIGDRETIGSLNQKLKDQYLDVADYQRVRWLSEIRAQCDHDKEKEPDAEAVEKLISQVREFISTVS
jgi:hypothetical protein